MAGIDRWKISPETRATFTAILDEAPHLGIDRDQVAAAGLPGLRALIALKGVAEAGTRRAKSRALADAQDAVASLAHRKQSRLVNQVQARLLALQGRGSDTEVAHVARGELVVPQAMQGTIVLQVLREAAAAQGIPLEMLRVGSGNNSINPATKAPEFGVMNWLEEVAGVRQQDPNYQREQEQGRNVGGIARILKYAGMAILALALVGYWEIVTKVRLANHSNATLVNAEIALDHGGPTLWAGNLAPGQSVWIWEMASGGKVALSYNQDGEKIQYFLGHAGAPAPFNGSTLVSVYDNGGIGMSKIPSLGTAVSYVADKVMP